MNEDILRTKMNGDILKGKWKELRGQVRAWWGQLNDNDINQIQGRYEQLIGRLQERYGYTRLEAEGEIRKFLKQVDAQVEERG
jgi:uncharacterized protein YjbJ (UPF0337 family)